MNRGPCFCLLLLAALCLSSPAPGISARAQESAQKKQEPEAAKQSGKSSEKKDESAAPQNPAQIELLETKIRFETNGDSRKEVHALVHINNELGVRQFARLNFDYNRSFESIEIPLVRVTHAHGGTSDVLPSAITDNLNPAVVNAPAYQDVRVKSVRILGLQPGDSLEYRVITNVSHHPLAPDFWLEHSFDRSGVVSQEIFELNLPGHLTSVTRMDPWHGGPGPALFIATPYTAFQYDDSQGNPGRSIYRWDIPSTRKLTPSKDEDGTATPDLLVSTFPTWFDLVNRLAPHVLDWNENDRKQAEAKAHASNHPSDSPEALLRASYDFVSQKITTIDLPVGTTEFHLRHASEILDSGYATPEEKCSLIALFAELAGMKVEIVFAGAPEIKKQFGRPSGFNHVFVIAPDKKKAVALDPSLEVAPFGLIAPQFQGKSALSLTLYDGGDFMSAKWPTLPTESPFSESQRVNVDAVLSKEGALSAKVKYAMRGDNELLLRVAFHQTPKERWKEVAQLLALSDGFRGQVANVTASDPYATSEPFTVEYEISQPKFVDWAKKPVRIPALLPQVGLPDPPALPVAGSAVSSIRLGTPLDVETTMTLHLPQGTTTHAPTGITVDRDYATFSSQYSEKSSTVTASRHIHFLLREVPGVRAADYNAFLRAVQNDSAQDFTLERAEVSPAKTDSAAPVTAAPPNPTSQKP